VGAERSHRRHRSASGARAARRGPGGPGFKSSARVLHQCRRSRVRAVVQYRLEAVAPSALGPLAAIPDPSGGSRAYFIGVDGHVYVLSPDRDPKASGWTAMDLTRVTGANAAGAGLAASVAPDGAQHVYFTDRYGKLYVLSKRTYTQPWDCKQFLPVGRS
jgi:hypothetical protein